MRKYGILSGILFPLLFYGHASGQARSDSTAGGYFTTFNLQPGKTDPFNSPMDTVFRDVYFFDAVARAGNGFPRSGGPGSAALDVFSDFSLFKREQPGLNQFNRWLVGPFKELPSDSSIRRYSNVDYHIASRKEQHIFLKHHQRIKPWLMAGIDFGAFAGDGEYTHQKFTNRNFDVWFAASTRSRVYRMYINFTSNRIQNQENGGIVLDYVFENASSLNTRTLAVNLQTAESVLKTRDYALKQDLSLSRLFHPRRDSLVHRDELSIGTLVWWNRTTWKFVSTTPDSNYFDDVFIDSTATNDSSFFDDLFTQALLEYTVSPDPGKLGYHIAGGVNYQHLDYSTGYGDTLLQSTEGIFIASATMGPVRAQVTGTMPVNETTEEYSLQAELNYEPGDKHQRFRILAVSAKKPQTLRDRMYFSNHFIWSHDFKPVSFHGVLAGWDVPAWKLGLRMQVYSVTNKVYYNEDQLPLIHPDAVTVGNFELEKSFVLGKFGSDIRLSGFISDNDAVVTVPPYATYASVYYKNIFFKSALGFKAGADVSTFGMYYLYGYMPVTGVFFLQDKKENGNYPTVSLFILFRIKTAGLFLRVDHVNAGITDRDYYGAWHQPMPARTVKFGVTWDFVD